MSKKKKFARNAENNILYVLKMLTKEKNWCYQITFNYDYENTDLSQLSFCIGPMRFNAQIIRNPIDYTDNTTFMLPKVDDDLLTENNNFYIFIDDNNNSGQCFMILKNKIYKYKEERPKLNSNYYIIEKKYIYKNSLWISNLPSDEDKMLLYPEKFMMI